MLHICWCLANNRIDNHQYEELPSFRREVVEGVVPSKVYYGKQLDQLTNGLAAMRQVVNQELDSEAIQIFVHI